MSHYEKIAFVWQEPQPFVEVPERLTFRPVDDSTMETLVDAVAQVMADSLDRSDQHSVTEFDARTSAERFIAEADDYFGFEISWWQLASNEQGSLVGFVLPVIFPGAEKDGLAEATIYYIGVLPKHRGQGYVYDLLCKNTRVLQEIGIWQIYSDTDVNNFPMIAAFKKLGYTQDGDPKEVALSHE